MTFEEVRRVALALPGMEDAVSYGTPSLKVRGKFLARLKEDGETLVLKLSLEEKEFLMEADPAVFFQTDHYKGWPGVLVRLAAIEPEAMRALVAAQWRVLAPKTLVKQYDAAHG